MNSMFMLFLGGNMYLSFSGLMLTLKLRFGGDSSTK